MDSVRAKASARKRKRESELLNPILSASYPFLSAGLEWTRPYDLMYVRIFCSCYFWNCSENAFFDYYCAGLATLERRLHGTLPFAKRNLDQLLDCSQFSLNSASDVTQIHVEPEYIPNGESDAVVINIGRDSQSGEKLAYVNGS